ncbi:MAG TPA: hypothetical protein VII35_03945, partial [Steroidobacteraceae bacterium]
GGVAAAPTPQERTAMHEPHVAPTPLQRQHIQEAARNPALAAKTNGGHPAIAATPKAAAFNAPGVVGARGAAPMGAAQLARTNGAAPGAEAPRVNNGYAPHVNGNRGLPPGAQATVTHVPPNGAVNARAAATKSAAAKQPAPKAQPQHAKPPKEEKHQEGGNR